MNARYLEVEGIFELMTLPKVESLVKDHDQAMNVIDDFKRKRNIRWGVAGLGLAISTLGVIDMRRNPVGDGATGPYISPWFIGGSILLVAPLHGSLQRNKSLVKAIQVYNQ